MGSMGSIPRVIASYVDHLAVGISIMGLSAWDQIWILLLANFGGAILATYVFKFVNPAEDES